MSSNYHTPISTGAAANAQTFNDPLGQMDEALSEALLLERDGHIIQDEGVDLAQQPRINFVGAGVTATNTPGKTVVTIPGGVSAHSALSGLTADDHPQYLLTSGLREWDEQSSNPSTPSANKWKLYFKPNGLHFIDDAGVVLGPLMAVINNYLTGLKLSNNVSDATNDIDIAAGIAADSTNSLMMALSSAITKRLDAAWVVGTNQGGLDTGSLSTWTGTVTISNATPAVVTWTSHPLVAGDKVVFTTTGALPTGLTVGQTYYVISTGLGANSFQVSATPGGTAINTSSAGSGTHTINVEKTYHVFLITRIDTGVVDALFSLSTTPTLPTNYTKYRRIGSIVRAAASIKAFVQDGDTFRWSVPVADVGHTNPGTSAVTRTLTVPTGIRIEAWVTAIGAASGAATDNAGGIFLSDLSMPDTAASTSAFSVYEYSGYAGAASNGGVVYCMTNTSAQVRSRVQISTAGTTLYITTHGWKDRRGKDG